MKELLIKEYTNTEIKIRQTKPLQNTISCNFVKGAFIEIIGKHNTKYNVKMINFETGETIWEDNITNNMYTRCDIIYYIKWKIIVTDIKINEIVYIHNFDPTGKRIYIRLDSSAIGDTIAWFPYIEEFKKKHNCKVICSTFHNDLFKKTYKEIEFIKPGVQVNDLYAMYVLGWWHLENDEVDKNKIPIDFKRHPLQQTASSILGLEYIEIKPKIKINHIPRKIKEKYVVIAPHASAHAKYWNYPGGWQIIIDFLNKNNYKVVMITKEPLGDIWHDSKLGGTLNNIIDLTGNFELKERISEIDDADLFIGVGSGLSWISWALDTPTVLISGFSEPYTEFMDCERIFNDNPNICSGCFNRSKLDAGDWEWCPEHKNTLRQFECTKTITPERVIESISKLLNIYNI